MTTTETDLETAFTKIREFDPENKAHFAAALKDMIEQVQRNAEFNEAMKDPAYRTYVEQALKEAEADRQAGRFEPIDQAMDRMERIFVAKHGL